MKLKLNRFLALLLVLISQLALAQQKNANGIVTDVNGSPLPGVNVVVKGSLKGTSTNFDGTFRIQAAPTDILVFSFMGMNTIERTPGVGMTIKLSDESTKLADVVVTALGIKRDKKSLGYASQKLDGAEVNRTPTNNFIDNLAGKVAGLEVRKNSNFGGSSNIILRGVKSITGNNQALIVLDGVPITNTNLNNDDTKSGRQGTDFGNSSSDIDPNNIETLTVLKGAAATALYGSQASNGAIMITTKKGKLNSGLGISYSSSISIGSYDKSTFPTYQKQYGQGYGGPSSFIVQDINGDGIDDTTTPTGDDASYGNAFDPNLLVYNWNAFSPGNTNFGKSTPWVAANNDPGTFFQNSVGTVNSINLNGGDDKSTFSFGYTNNGETGILVNSKLNKNTLTGNFSRNLSDKIRVGAFYTFSNQNTVGRNTVGYGDNFMTGFRQWWPVNVDLLELKQDYFRNLTNATWNFESAADGKFRPIYWNNPYFERYQNYSSDSRTRVITGANLSYDITKKLNLLGRVTVETTNDRQELRKAVGSRPESFGVTGETIGSGYDLYTRNFIQTTYDFLATYETKVSEKFNAKILGGTNFIKANAVSYNGSTTGGLAAPNLYTLANSNVFVAPRTTNLDYEKFGIFTQATLDYDKILYLEGSFRQDNTTALKPGNDTYSYYSLGSSFVFSELLKADWLSYGKLRASNAVVGNDPAYGRIGARRNLGLVGSSPAFGNSSVYTDYSKLVAEKQNSIEFGLETSMFNKRLNLDLSVYKTNSFNQIINVPQSTSTGYATSQINAGELQNKGIEVALSGYPIKTEKFQWMIGVNWSKNKNELIRLDEGRSNLQLANFQDGVSLNATVGEAYGTFRGTDYIYDSNGNKVVDASGQYLTQNDKVLGNIQADWIGGLNNKFTYKNLSFNFLIDVKQGGSVYSLDQNYGLFTGLYPETAGNNDLGNPVRDPLTTGANSGGIILPGVFANGTPNNIRIDATTAGAAFGNGTRPQKAFIYDASFVKLREIGLTYNLPIKLLKNSALKGASFSILGSNVWIINKKLPYSDPETGTSSGNIQGFQSGVLPSVKTYSFNVKVNF